MYLSKRSTVVYYLWFTDELGHIQKVSTRAKHKAEALKFLQTFIRDEFERKQSLVRVWLSRFGNYFHMADVKGLFVELDGWIRMRVRCFIERKKAVKHQNYCIPNAVLSALDLGSLMELRTEYLLLPTTGQSYRKAVCGKSVRTV